MVTIGAMFMATMAPLNGNVLAGITRDIWAICHNGDSGNLMATMVINWRSTATMAPLVTMVLMAPLEPMTIIVEMVTMVTMVPMATMVLILTHNPNPSANDTIVANGSPLTPMDHHCLH